jgi:hydrogenase nickel incorporation protein HypA/HybF
VHELPVTQSILSIVLQHAETHQVSKVMSISLRIGALSHLEDEPIQRYFDYLSRATVAEGARIVIERVPAKLKCEACSNCFEIDIRQVKEIQCPECGDKKCSLVSGTEYYIDNMVAQ